MTEDFRRYQQQIINNAQALARGLTEKGFRLVSGGTDNHLMLVDLRSRNLTGKDAEKILDEVGITVNKNTIPFDPQSPFVTSGIRLGTPALTSRGFTEEDMAVVAEAIHLALSAPEDEAMQQKVKGMVAELCARHPLY